MHILELPCELMLIIFDYCDNHSLRILNKCYLFTHYFQQLNHILEKEAARHVSYWNSLYKDHFSEILRNDSKNIQLGLDLDSDRWPQTLIDLEKKILKSNYYLLDNMLSLPIDTIIEINYTSYENLSKDHSSKDHPSIFGRASILIPKYNE